MNRNATAAHFRFKSILLAGFGILLGILVIVFASSWAHSKYLHYAKLYDQFRGEVTKAQMGFISIIEAV